MIEKVTKSGMGYSFIFNSNNFKIDNIYPFKPYAKRLHELESKKDVLKAEYDASINDIDTKLNESLSVAIVRKYSDKKIKDIHDEVDTNKRTLELSFKNNTKKIDDMLSRYLDDISKDAIGALFIYLQDKNNKVLPEVLTQDDVIIRMKKDLTSYIYNTYNAEKQSQDSNNEMNARTRVIAIIQSHQSPGPLPVEYEPYVTLESYIVKTVTDIITGTVLYSDVVITIPSDIKLYVSKLLRIALRTAWVDNCKVELDRAITAGDNPVYVPMYTI